MNGQEGIGTYNRMNVPQKVSSLISGNGILLHRRNLDPPVHIRKVTE
jgi:hypothetical protein